MNFEELAKVEILLRHIGNSRQLPTFHDIRYQSLEARTALERALGDEYPRIFETQLWKAQP